MPSDAPATVVDFRDLLPALLDPGPAGARARALGRIVAAATAIHGGLTVQTAIRCRRRPHRRPCPGHLLVRRQDLPSAITWGCPECRDRGILSGFRGAPQDLTGTQPPLQAECEVVLEDADYRAVEGVLTLRPDAERVVMAATFTPHGIRLSGRRAEFDALWGDLTAARGAPEVGAAGRALGRAAVEIGRVR